MSDKTKERISMPVGKAWGRFSRFCAKAIQEKKADLLPMNCGESHGKTRQECWTWCGNGGKN